LNIPKALEGLDINTRNQYFATLIGQEAGYNNIGKYNTFIGYKAGTRITTGASNTFLGANAGLNATETNNILIGVNTGAFLTSGSRNIFLGTNTGQYSRGNNNVYIGYNNTNTISFNTSSNNIGIGSYQETLGYNNISIGRNNATFSSNTLLYGNDIRDFSLNSIIIGNNIYNNGSNVCIIKNTQTSNSEHNYTNFNDILINSVSSNNTYTYINGDYTSFNSGKTFDVQGDTFGMTLTNSNVSIFGSNYGMILKDDGTYIYGQSNNGMVNDYVIQFQNQSGYLNINRSNISLASSNVGTLHMNTVDGIALSNNMGSFVVTSNTTGIYSSNGYLSIGSNVNLRNTNYGITISDTIVLDGPIEFGDTLKAKDAIFSSNVYFMDRVAFSYNSNINKHWEVFLDTKTTYSSDLIFKSLNNTVVSFTDDFKSELLNFTGKHRCSYVGCFKGLDKYIGMIVSSCGFYKGLNNEEDIQIDEALPVVKISRIPYDKTVFGVISGFEEINGTRGYQLGNLQFVHEKKVIDSKVIVNSHGEGGIWVCDVNGPLHNGDLITTSFVPGVGMKQGSDDIKNYTVAKITCNCDFDMNSKIYRCMYVKYRGRFIRKAFVGCIYKL
jgi:hypothetical protein